MTCTPVNRRRYNNELLRLGFLLFTRSSAAYRLLFESDILIVPHVSTLRRLSGIFNVTVGLENTEQVQYLKLCSSGLDDRSRLACLQMDEIHVNPVMTFKGGSLRGQAVNSEDQAHSVQAFMISSVFGHASEIVSLHPVKNLTAEDLCSMLKKAIAAVHASGFVVIAIIADNNQINCKAYEILSGTGNLEHDIANPHMPDGRIFLLFDTVHILKCIRNNWLNQKDPDQTFRYPAVSSELMKTARLLTSNNEGTGIENLPTSSRPIAVQETASSTGAQSTGVYCVLSQVPFGNLNHAEPTAVYQPVFLSNSQFQPWSMNALQNSTVVPMTNILCSLPVQTVCAFPVATGSVALFPVLGGYQLLPAINVQTLQQSTQQQSSKLTQKKLAATVSCLKELYKGEKNTLVKTAHKLSFKSLYPSNLERQQVSLALNIFNEFNVAALEMKTDETCKQTACFIRVITAWWRIVNVKQSHKGVQKRDVLSFPISEPGDERLKFLEHFAEWLQSWGSGDDGCLTRQTFRALHHTCVGLVRLAKYAFTALPVKYILLGKLQTDNLER